MIIKEFEHFILEIQSFEDRSRGILKEAVKIQYDIKHKLPPNRSSSVKDQFFQIFYGQEVHGEYRIKKIMEKELKLLLKIKDLLDEDGNLTYRLYFEKDTAEKDIINQIIDVISKTFYSEESIAIVKQNLEFRKKVGNLLKAKSNEEILKSELKQMVKAYKDSIKNEYVVSKIKDYINGNKDELEFIKFIINRNEIINAGV